MGLAILCVTATAINGCDMAQFLTFGTTTAISDDGLIDDNLSSSMPTSLRIESAQGVFVLSDAFSAKNPVDAKPNLLAWWKDADTGEISIWGRLIHTQEDVGHTLLGLEYDFGTDILALAAQNDSLNQAIAAASESTEDSTTWQPSSFALAVAVMGFESPDLDEAVALDARLFATGDEQNYCLAVAKAIRTNSDTSKSISDPLNKVFFGIINLCGGGGGGDGGTPCPGDIDCDGTPDDQDWDIDGDGIPNIIDPDVDGDGIPNGEDSDVDGDGTPNSSDDDIDGDGLANSDDSDADGDGTPNSSDDDIDGDGTPNDQDDDDDGDGTPDTEDTSPGGCNTDCLGACCNTTAGTCTLKSAATCSGPNEQFKGTSVVCNLNPCCPAGNNPTFPPNSATISSINISFPPSLPDAWGATGTRDVVASIDVSCDGTKWCAVLTGLNGVYHESTRLLPGVSEVTGPPPGNTTQGNNCTQLTALKGLSNGPARSLGWFMLQAIISHEDVHVSHLLPTLISNSAAIESSIEAVCVPHVPGMTKTNAKSVILGSTAYENVSEVVFNMWQNAWSAFKNPDHAPGGPTEQAEQTVVNPMIASICAYNKSQCWSVCSVCPTRPTGACCDPSAGACSIKTKCDCEANGGIYRGDNTTCDPTNPCQGACCTASFSCIDTTTQTCSLIFQGSYQGDGTTCASGVCGPPQ